MKKESLKCPNCGKNAFGTIIDGRCAWCWRDKWTGEIDALQVENEQLKKECQSWHDSQHTWHRCKDGNVSTYPEFLCSRCLCGEGEDFSAKQAFLDLEAENKKLKKEQHDLFQLMDSVRDEARNRNPNGVTILDFMSVWNEQYEKRIKKLEYIVSQVDLTVDGELINEDNYPFFCPLGHEVELSKDFSGNIEVFCNECKKNGCDNYTLDDIFSSPEAALEAKEKQ